MSNAFIYQWWLFDNDDDFNKARYNELSPLYLKRNRIGTAVPGPAVQKEYAAGKDLPAPSPAGHDFEQTYHPISEKESQGKVVALGACRAVEVPTDKDPLAADGFWKWDWRGIQKPDSDICSKVGIKVTITDERNQKFSTPLANKKFGFTVENTGTVTEDFNFWCLVYDAEDADDSMSTDPPGKAIAWLKGEDETKGGKEENDWKIRTDKQGKITISHEHNKKIEQVITVDIPQIPHGECRKIRLFYQSVKCPHKRAFDEYTVCNKGPNPPPPPPVDCDNVFLDITTKDPPNQKISEPKKNKNLGFIIKNLGTITEDFNFWCLVYDADSKEVIPPDDALCWLKGEDGTTGGNEEKEWNIRTDKKGTIRINNEQNKEIEQTITADVPQIPLGKCRKIRLLYESVHCRDKVFLNEYTICNEEGPNPPPPINDKMLLIPKKSPRPHPPERGSKFVGLITMGVNMEIPESYSEGMGEITFGPEKRRIQSGDLDFLLIKPKGKFKIGWVCYIQRKSDGELMNPDEKHFNLRVNVKVSAKKRETFSYSGKGFGFGYKYNVFNTPVDESDINKATRITFDPYIRAPLEPLTGEPRRQVPNRPTTGEYRLAIEIIEWPKGMKGMLARDIDFGEKGLKVIDINYVDFIIEEKQE